VDDFLEPSDEFYGCSKHKKSVSSLCLVQVDEMVLVYLVDLCPRRICQLFPQWLTSMWQT